MTLTPLLDAPLVIHVHALSALAALPLGALLLLRPKGTTSHKALGRLWAALMLLATVTSLLIHEMGVRGPFGPIHLLALVVLWNLAQGLWAIAVRRDVAAHRARMEDLYLWSLLIAGAFTLWPGRRMHQVLFGPDAAGLVAWLPLLAVLVTALAWRLGARRNRLAGASPNP